MNTQDTAPFPPDMPTFEQMDAALTGFSGNLMQESKQRFDDMLPRIAARLMGDDQAANAALEAGGFFIDESTVVIQYNEEAIQIEFFCDVGLPQLHAEQEVYRAALEYNLCRTYPGITFGVHPQSGRLVATTTLHLLLVADVEVCLNTVQIMTTLAKEVREALRLSAG